MNPENYFDNRYAQALETEARMGVSSKMDSLRQASARKVQALDQGIAQAKQRELANASSLVGKLGLDPESIAGQATNLAASLASGTTHVVGDIAGFLAGDFEAMVRTGAVSDEEIQAVNRYRQGKASDADIELINRRAAADRYTPLENLSLADKARARSAAIDKATDFSGLVHGDRRRALSADLGENFDGAWDQTKAGAGAIAKGDLAGAGDLLAGVGKLIFNAGEAAVTHPGAVAEYMAENLPQLAMGAFGKAGKGAMLLANVGYASENYQQGITNYQAKNNGAFPPLEERQRMAAQAASLALAEHLGELGQLKAATGAAKALENTAKAGLVQSAKNTLKAAVLGFGEEGLTEGYQTWAEGEVTGKPASAKDIYEGGVIGGLAGGGLSGGGRAIGEITKSTPEHLAEVQDQQARREVQLNAITTGDVSPLLDTKSKHYSPAHAIAALAGNSTLDTATEESRQANLAKASEIVTQLTGERDSLRANTAEGIKFNEQRIAELERTGDKDIAEMLRADVEDAKKLSPAELDKNSKALAKLDERLNAAHEAMANFATDTTVRTTEASPSDPAAAINLSMAAPERLDTATATELASDQANGLSSGQRDYLKAFAAAREAESATKDMSLVSHEVMVGGNGNVGLAQYRQRVTAALLAGNTDLAQQQLEQLGKFAQSHASKTEALNAAIKQGLGTQVLPVDGKWQVLDTRMDPKRVNKLGGYTVNSPKLVAAVRAESRAISAVLNELKAAQAAQVSQAQPQGVSNVSDVSQSHPSAQDLSGGSQVQAVEGAGEAATAGSAGVREGVSAGNAAVSPTEPVRSSVEAQPKTEKSTTQTTEQTKALTSSQSPEETLADSSGQVTAIGRKSAEGATYQQQELIGDHFTQTASKEGDATSRPLVKVKDFLSQGWGKATDFLKTKELSEKQAELLDTFQAKAKEWADVIQGNLTRRNRDFWFEDLVQFLMTEQDGKLDLEENVKTAMAYSAFSWVAEQQGREPYNTDEEINAILGRDEDTPVQDHERAALMLAGTRQQLVANALGQRALQALGLRAKSSAPLDLQPKLESQMGMHILKLLADKGYIERSQLSAEQMSQLRTGVDEFAKHYFIKVTRGALTQDIFEASRGTQGVLDKLFSVEPGLKEPTREPVKFAQKTTRNTNQAVPSKLAEIEQKQNAAEWRVRQDMFSLVSVLDEEIRQQIAGAKSTDEATTHKTNRSSNQAKNDSLRREWDRAIEFFTGLVKEDDSLSMPIHFEHTVWKQQRVGISTNMVNPQTSKIHRHMLYLGAWESEVKFSDMDNFKLRVLEGLGTKTDKQGNEKSLASFEETIAKPEIKAAVAVLVRHMAGTDLTKEDQETLAAGVKKGGENMHSLDALMALAHMERAAAAGKPSFTVQMMGEVDGVTNGPMLSHLLLGAAESADDLFELLNKGGFFQLGNEHSQYNLWRGAAGHFDLYEKTAGNMVKTMHTLMADGVKSLKGKLLLDPKTVSDAAAAIYAFTGELADKNDVVQKAGRNIVKTPLTAMVFGSSVSNSVESMAEKFVESIYAAIEDTANGKPGAMTREQLIKHINTLLDIGGGKRLDGTETLQDLMNGEFAGSQLEGVKKAFKDTLGRAIADTMKQDFAVFIEKRRQFNLAAETTFTLYNSVYQALRADMVDKLVAKHPKTGAPLHDLTKAQESELQKQLKGLFPVLHTAFSKESNQLRAGLEIAKTNRELSKQSTYVGNVKFATGFPDDGSKSATTRGFQIVSKAPGVAMAPMSVHSLDSYISHMAAALGQVLNVHDAHGAGLNNFEQTARNLNQATWNAMLSYSPASEMQASLSRTVQGLAKLLESPDLSPAVVDSLKAAISKLASDKEMDPETFVSDMLAQTKVLAAEADRVKLQALAQMQSIDQYALEGGNYEVTEADRAAANAKLSEVSAALSAEEQAALATIEQAVAGVKRRAKAEPSIDEDPVTQKSPFGQVGKPNVEADPALVEFFKQNPNPTAGQLVSQLHSMLKDRAGRKAEAYLQLLRLVNKVVDKAMPVQLVTPQTAAEDVLEAPKQPSVGWFVSKGGQSRIHLLSSEFQNSGLTAETVLHELIHGSLAEVVANELAQEAKNPKYRSEALELVQELEELRDLAKAYAKQNGVTGFEEALGNVQEFITYGLTNQAFQRQVLSQVSMKSRTQGNSLVNGMKAFIEKVVGILFKGSSKDVQAQAINGLTVLVSNVSGLFNQAAQAKTESKPSVNLSMATQRANTILKDYTTTDIHQALDNTGLSQEFSEKLQGLLVGIVQKLHGPFGALKAQVMQQQALTPQDVWLKALSTGQAPFASSVLVSPLKATEQEAHAMEQVEATVRAALEYRESSMSLAYKELVKVFTEAQTAITPAEVGGQAAHDFLFKVELGADGRSNHLARFAAYALAHQEFSGLLSKKLSVNGTGAAKTAKTFGERVQAVLEKILSFFQERANGTFSGQAYDARVEALVGRLVDIEAKRRMQILRGSSELLLMVAEKGSDVMEKAKATAINAMKNSSNQKVRTVGKIAGLAASGRIDALFDTLQDFRDRRFKGNHGVAMQLLTEVRGPGQMLNLLSLASTNAQRMRKDIITMTSKHVRGAFANGGKGITRATSAAITQVFLRTGTHALVDRFNMTEIEQLLSDPKALQKAITDTENQLNPFGRFKDQFIHQANALGYFRVTGEAKHARLMMNAHNIARLYGTAQVGKISEQDAKAAEKHIEQLVALYAIEYTKSSDRSAARDALRAELQRTDGLGNGVDFTLRLHKRLEQEANARVFQDQKALMLHGYTPEILNPNKQLKVATKAEGDELVKQGYQEVGQLELDSADPDRTPKFLYVVQDGGLMAYRSGITSLTGKSAKGTTKHNGYLNVNVDTGLENASTNADIAHGKTTKLASGPRPDLSKLTKTHMVPIVNPQGEIVNWRYMMQDKTRDSVLDRDSSFDKMLGVMAGSTFDKESSLEVNRKTFEALHALSEAERYTQPDSYVLVGPNSTDPKLKEIWAMLPEDTRKVARSLWSKDGMYVRKDQLTTVFGYRKLSLADALRKEPLLRSKYEEVFATAVENAFAFYKRLSSPGTSRQEAEEYAKRAAVYVARGERVWQDIVREMKDTIVVKSITVSLGNISSNISLLLAQGVPLKDVLQGHLVALRGARAYMHDHDELTRLQRIVDTGTAGVRLASITREINRLQDSINRNPVKEMIDAGLMPTIVEDIAEEDDIYSYKSALARKVDPYVGKLPGLVKEAGKQLYMGKDTRIYQGLSRLAQVSDFAARYALYQHLVNRAEKPLDKATATHEASEAFINYDIPMPKWLQYTDDMGITMFTKYVMRIQRVLARVAQEHPARVLMMLTIDKFANLGPIVLDSSWVHKLGHNPLNWGALQAPGAMDELATVQAAMALVK